MTPQELKKAATAERDRWAGLLEAVDFAIQHEANKKQRQALDAAKDRLEQRVAELEVEYKAISGKKGAATRDLAKQIEAGRDELMKTLDTRRAARDAESAKDDDIEFKRKALHKERMDGFDKRERKAAGLARKAEDWLARMKKLLAAA